MSPVTQWRHNKYTRFSPGLSSERLGHFIRPALLPALRYKYTAIQMILGVRK